MEDVFNFIKPELLILIPVLYFIGLGIKKSNIPDKHIPLLLGIISIFLSTLWVFSTSEIKDWQDVANAVFVSITQGILTAGTTVYANQLYIQFKRKWVIQQQSFIWRRWLYDCIKAALTVRTAVSVKKKIVPKV